MSDSSNDSIELKRLNAVIETQALLASAELNQQTFMNLVTERMLLITPSTGAVVEFVDGDEMVYIATSASIAQFKGLRLKRANSLSGFCVANKQMLICNDTDTDPRINQEASKRINAHSMIVTPLDDKGEVLGVLKVFSDQKNAYQVTDLQTLQLMAGLIGSALRHQKQFDAIQALLTERHEAVNNLELEIEKRIKIETDLRNKEHRTRLIIDHAYDAFIGINQQLIIFDWNPTAETIFGITKQAALGKKLTSLVFSEKSQSEFEQYFLTGDANKLDKRIQLTAKNHTGTEFPIELAMTAIELNGTMDYFIFLHDISERKKIDRLKNEFVSIVSHELRTPLTSMLGSLTLIETGMLGSLSIKAVHLITVCKKNAERLLHLINDILDIEKIEAGKTEFNFTTVSINTIIQEAVSAHQSYAEKFNKRIIVSSIDDALVKVDQAKLMRVMANLISNAVKFGFEETTVNIEATISEDSVKVSISNIGEGIPADFQSRIFQKFSQANSSASRTFAGTGLGLSICKELIERMGGKIDFISKPNAQTAFFFTLARVTADQTPSDKIIA